MPDEFPPSSHADIAALPKFVRVIEELDNGLVSFEFAIGWPELSVELMLPAPAFAEFCARERVQLLKA